MCRSRLQEAGAETHSPVVHQLQNSTTASNDVTQLKKKKKEEEKKKNHPAQTTYHNSAVCTLEASTKQVFKGESTTQIARGQEKTCAPLGWDSSV